ncbi:MAG: DegQ family serine endoprotease [Pseudomonadota bacterium]|nr:DegQ family serine endoprotease [Pseudomonadota bacterium]
MVNTKMQARRFSAALVWGWCLLGASALVAAELPDFTDLVKRQSAVVVNISTETTVQSRRQAGGYALPDDMPEFFRRFFDIPGAPNGRAAPPQKRRNLGSGFVISADGYILTNNHVVQGADEITVALTDRHEFVAELVGADPASDLALLKVDAKGLPVAKFGDSDALEVGEWVLAIGSPFGFDYSVSAGIVSATGRSLPNDQNQNYVPFIQTDVAINPGNSGGPLFNMKGEVVGINSMIYTRSGGFMGLSFAIPTSVALNVVEQLKESGRVTRGWLGVSIQEVNRDLAESFGLRRPHGALVVSVVPDSPAAAAGLEPGDVIVEVEGQTVNVSGDLPHIIGRLEPGTKAKIEVVRSGKRRALTARIGELPEDPGQVAQQAPPTVNDDNRLQVRVRDLSPALRQRLGVEAGVEVVEVGQGPGAAVGLRPGTVITRIGDQIIEDVDDFERVVQQLPAGELIPMRVIRDGVPGFLAFKLPE